MGRYSSPSSSCSACDHGTDVDADADAGADADTETSAGAEADAVDAFDCCLRLRSVSEDELVGSANAAAATVAAVEYGALNARRVKETPMLTQLLS